MEVARLSAIIEAKDTGVAEKFRATDAALASMGQRAQDTAAKAVRLTETISLQQRQLDLAKASLAQVVDRYGATSEAAEKKRITIDRLQASLATNERRLEQTKEALRRMTEEADRGKNGWASLEQVAVGAMRKIGELGVEAIGRTISALGDLTKEAAQQYITYENLEGATQALIAAEMTQADSGLSMAEAMTQASGKAQELLKWQSDLALQSPFGEEGIAKTFQQAQAYGFLSETASKADVDARRLTNAVIDYAAASRRGEEGAQGVALALGQIQAKGKLSAQEMNQLAERGINAKAILSDALGVTTEEFIKLQEKGAIPAKEAVAVIVEYLENNFQGAAKNASETFGGTLAKLEEVKNIGLREFFEGTAKAIGPILKDIGDALGDPSVREGIRETGKAFGQWVLDVVEGAEVVRRAAVNTRSAFDQMVQGAVENLTPGQKGGLVGFLEGTQRAIENATGITAMRQAVSDLGDGIIALSGVQQQAAPAAAEQAAAFERDAIAMANYGAGARAAADDVERLGDAKSAAAQAGGSTDAAAALREAIGARADATDAEQASKELEAAAQRYQERLEDLARDGGIKRREAAEDHAAKLADIERDALRDSEARAQAHAEKLVDLETDAGRRRAEAIEASDQQLADLETSGQRQREDLARDYAAKLVDIARDQAREREAITVDAAQAEADAEQTGANRRADIARDLGRAIEDQERITADRRADIQRDIQDKLDDLAQRADERRADAADRLSERLATADERYADQRASLEEQLGQATTVEEQNQIRAKMARLEEKAQAERVKIEAEAAREQQRIADQETRDAIRAQEAAARKLADEERRLEEQRAAAERAAQRKLDDLALSEERERQQRATDQARKLADLQLAQAAELDQERAAYAAKLAEQQIDQERRRADLLADRERKLVDLAEEASALLEAERIAYAEREAEARRHLAQKRADELQSYADRLSDLQQAQADRRAAEDITAARATDEAATTAGAAAVQARLAQARAAAEQASQAAAAATVNNYYIEGSVLTESELRAQQIRAQRRTGGRYLG